MIIPCLKWDPFRLGASNQGIQYSAKHIVIFLHPYFNPFRAICSYLVTETLNTLKQRLAHILCKYAINELMQLLQLMQLELLQLVQLLKSVQSVQLVQSVQTCKTMKLCEKLKSHSFFYN